MAIYKNLRPTNRIIITSFFFHYNKMKRTRIEFLMHHITSSTSSTMMVTNKQTKKKMNHKQNLTKPTEPRINIVFFSIFVYTYNHSHGNTDRIIINNNFFFTMEFSFFVLYSLKLTRLSCVR